MIFGLSFCFQINTSPYIRMIIDTEGKMCYIYT